GLLGHFDQAVIAASFCKLYRPIDMTLGPILYLHMKRQFENDEMPYFQNVAANGIANFQSQRYLSESSIALPSDENLLSRMSEVLRALIDTTLSDQIRCLRATRDLLLPKLISGEIDVSTAAAPELAPALDIAAE
ncbi:MAG: hypothetical protein KGJ05_10225, partial [Alphaproteobacteria bacterium]|nr:hypothetical protein [Alphaproteobacteria bacterium]